MAARFRGFLPVVIDVETGGFNAASDALLELAAVTVAFDDDGTLVPAEAVTLHIEPFEGANIEPAALEFNGIDPYNPLRGAVSEKEALQEVFRLIRTRMKATGCTRAVLVGHNAHFDHGFVMAAVERAQLKRNPFHPFSCFDTATLAGLALGQTVLARACETAEIPFDSREAHSALYDAERTAELFCSVVNRWRDLGGWPLPAPPAPATPAPAADPADAGDG
ncbi:MAG TPA: ribonuclease T [Pseudomonadales bacterium]|nr:ribonuclease T [Pseudomonadales bacterium]